MPECSLGTLNESLTDVRDSKLSHVRRGDMVVDDRSEVNSHIIFGHADLLWDLADLNHDIYVGESLRKWVDFDKTRVNCAIEAAKFGDQTDGALVYTLVRVGAAETWRGK